jgi:DNA-binding NtrC family response regulator
VPVGESSSVADTDDAGSTSLDERLIAVEKQMITWALGRTSGNKSKAAALLKVRRSTLGDRIKKLGLGHLESADAGEP